MSETLTITLPDDLAAKVRASVDDGEFASADAAITGVLGDWAERRDNFGYSLAELREIVRIGDESGPSIPAEQVYAELHAIIDEYRTKE